MGKFFVPICYYSRARNAHKLRIPWEHDSGVRGDFAKQTSNITPKGYYERPQAVNSNSHFFNLNRLCMRFSYPQCAIIRFERLKTSYRGFCAVFSYTKAIAASISYQYQTSLISILLVSDCNQASLTWIPVYRFDYQLFLWLFHPGLINLQQSSWLQFLAYIVRIHRWGSGNSG